MVAQLGQVWEECNYLRKHDNLHLVRADWGGLHALPDYKIRKREEV